MFSPLFDPHRTWLFPRHPPPPPFLAPVSQKRGGDARRPEGKGQNLNSAVCASSSPGQFPVSQTLPSTLPAYRKWVVFWFFSSALFSLTSRTAFPTRGNFLLDETYRGCWKEGGGWCGVCLDYLVRSREGEEMCRPSMFDRWVHGACFNQPIASFLVGFVLVRSHANSDREWTDTARRERRETKKERGIHLPPPLGIVLLEKTPSWQGWVISPFQANDVQSC